LGISHAFLRSMFSAPRRWSGASRHPAPRFRLTRYFALTSLIGIGVVMAGLIGLFSELMLLHLVEQNTRSNAALAELFSRRMWAEHEPYLRRATGRSGEQLRADPGVQQLDRMVRSEMRGLPVAKVKLYAIDGVTAYSTDPAQIGEHKGRNDGVLRALAGEVSGGHTHRDRFDAFDGVIADRDFVFTYIPVRRPDDGRVGAVLEIYADVTESRAQDRTAQWQVVGLVLGLLGMLYLCLAAIVHRADRMIMRQDDEAAEREALIRHQSLHDSLTRLPNRMNFGHRMTDLSSVAARQDIQFALMFIDLDGFKRVNDSLGHHAGDLLLQVVAGRIRKVLRGSDLLFRMGGDEFTVVLTESASRENAIGAAQRIVSVLAEPLTLEGRQVGIGASVGLAFYPEDGVHPDELLRKADLAMYRAKQAGGRRYACCSSTDNAAPTPSGTPHAGAAASTERAVGSCPPACA